MLGWLLLRKANAKSVKRILEKEGFIYTDIDVTNLLKGNTKGTRYGAAVLKRKESSGVENRFFKFLLDGNRKTYKPFRRQVEVTRALAEDKNYNLPKIAVLSSSFNPPVPYAIFETREDGEGFGFMNDEPRYYKEFQGENISNLARIIYEFHLSGHSVDPKVFKYTEKTPNNVEYYIKDLNQWLSMKVQHKYKDGKVEVKTVEELLGEYFPSANFRKGTREFFKRNWPRVKASSGDRKYLVQNDTSLDNTYKHKDGRLELLDFEWVGSADNPMTPIIFDYGNLYGRAWASKQFQSDFTSAMEKEGVKKYGDEELVKTALNLGFIRSGIMLCRYRFDYKHTTRNDKRTDEMYFNMLESTLGYAGDILKLL